MNREDPSADDDFTAVPDDSTATLAGVGTRLGPYRIEGLVGAGGMGQVFRALDTRLGRAVALKVSNAKFSDRFEREARSIASLNHPHICTLYDVGPNYLVMELLEGESLAERLRKGSLPAESVLRFGSEIADALAAAHAKGITHRDLKPGNIMITKSGIKVLDFGLAKSTQDDTLTVPLAVMGTPAYMAPEQLEGKECDARSDIFSFGLVLSEMATGKRVGQGRQPQLDSIPGTLAHTIERCLNPNPEDRWQTARDVKAELEWAAKPTVRQVPARGKEPTSLLWPAVAALALIAFAALAWVHFSETSPQASVSYATILPPEKTSFDFRKNLGPVAVSPDGRSMVFSATGEDDQSHLWLRSLNSPESHLLPGTERGTFPFWSPDGRWIGFFANATLKKIDTRGGLPITLTEVVTGLGGSWSAKGEIVFASTPFAPLLKISSDGGKTSVAIEAQGSVGNAYGFPWFLPDSEHFLFVSWSGSGRMKLQVGSLGSTASQSIGEVDSNAVYSAGHLLYLRQNSLVAQPFNLETLQAEGEAVPIAEHVERFLDLIQAGAFSASTSGLLAYQTGEATEARQLTWFDRQGKSLKSVGEPRAFFTIELSPDGKSLAASAPDSVGNYDLWMYDLARDLPTRFTVDPGGEYWAIWSPDGKSIVFNSTRRGHYDLYRKSANGAGAEELLYSDDTDKVPMSWSGDARFLLYFTGGGAQHNMWKLPLTAERPGAPLKAEPMHPTRLNELNQRFSPDGRWVVYTSDESGRFEIYAAPFSRITEKHQISTEGGTLPRWRGDGKAIFYPALDGRLMETEVLISGEAVEVKAPHATSLKISSTGGYLYDVSADGQRVLAALPARNGKPPAPITLVQDWSAALTK